MFGRQKTGIIGQKIAEKYLTENDYKILEKNIRLGRLEIDIIALDEKNSFLVFCEVKTRTSNLGDANLKQDQIQRLKKAMALYSSGHGFFVEKCRLDYIEVCLQSDVSRASLRHLKDILN